MRIKIELAGESPVSLPTGFNEYLQAFIYEHLDNIESYWLHDEGFSYEKRKFRLFTFSSILERGKYNKNENRFTFPNTVSFYISSPVSWILEQLAKNILQRSFAVIGSNRLTTSCISVFNSDHIDTNSIIVRALTPVEVHSTFKLDNGRKKTHYYTPYEKEFGELVNSNIRKKWEALNGEECRHSITIRPLFNGNKNERIVYYGTGKKKTVIKGWKGRFRLDGEPEILRFALDAGLGSRNSQGFGMVEVVG